MPRGYRRLRGASLSQFGSPLPDFDLGHGVNSRLKKFGRGPRMGSKLSIGSRQNLAHISALTQFPKRIPKRIVFLPASMTWLDSSISSK